MSPLVDFIIVEIINLPSEFVLKCMAGQPSVSTMFKKICIIILILLAFLLLVSFYKPAIAESPNVIVEKELTVPELIHKYAELYGSNEQELLKVAQCESHLDPTVVGDGGRAKQVFQYHKETFDRHSKLLGENLDYASTEDNIKLAAFIFAKHPDSRNEWTTYVAIKNGGKYSFYSRLLKSYFVVYCK